MSELLSIVINNNILRIAQLHRSRNGTRVKRLLEKECPKGMVDDSTVKEPEAFAGFLKLMLNGANIRAREAVFTLPADKLMTREVVLPDLPDARIRQIVDTNAGEYFPINLEDYVVGFYRVAAVRKESEAPGETSPADGGKETVPEAEGTDELAGDADIELTSFQTSKDSDERKKKRKKKKHVSRLSRSRHSEESSETAGTAGAEEKGRRRHRGEVRVMVIAAPNEMVRALYETASYLRIRSVSVDYIGNSVFRLAKMQVGWEPTLTVDISGDHTALTFFDCGDMIMQRNVDFGLDQIVDIVAREKWVSPERADEILRTKAIISDDLPLGDSIGEPLHFAIDMIRRTMIYYTRNRGMQPVERVILMGDAVYYRGMRDLLETELSVPVVSLDQINGVTIPRTAMMHDQAMRFLDNYGAAIAPVGLVSQELARERERRKGRKIYQLIFAAAAVGCATLIAVPGLQYWKLSRQVDELSKSVEKLKDSDQVLAGYEEARLRGEDVRNVAGITSSHNDELSAFITQLEEKRPRGLDIESFTIDEGEITMTVLATGKDVIAAMLRGLETMDNVSEVEASALISYYDNGKETVSCTLSCMLTSKEKRDYESTAQTAGKEAAGE
ncbi:MAG: pilus assembly protein PilM [Lachnospiraceae bacterium]|nr:pilus assembly protein PilM [Lachnospiraceae bacterium]